MEKQKFLVICIAILLLASCNIPSSATPSAQPEITASLPVNTAAAGGTVTLNNVSFMLPLGVANDARTEMVPAATDTTGAPMWNIFPAHLKFVLTGYQLQDKFFEPTILVLPADEYAQLNPAAGEQIQKLKAILAGSTLSMETMPSISTLNAAPTFASQMQLLDFQTGRGFRAVTQYAQYPAPVNNRELFYHFQGLTQDGKYYVIAILPVTSSILAEDAKPESPVPAGGVSLPTDTLPGDAYYDAVTTALNAMYPDSFNPSLFQLDALVQSITVTP